MKALRDLYERLGARLVCFLQSEEGQGLVEYALILVLIAIVVIVMLKGMGLGVNNVYSKVNSALDNP